MNKHLELDIKREAHKLSVRANNGDLVGPDLESAILDLFMWAWDRMDTAAPTLREAMGAYNHRAKVQ